MADQRPEISRRTLRLTVKINDDGGYELVNVERLQMITPPQPGERPEIGKHGGNWMELRGSRGRVLAHRLIDTSLLHSAEVHEADGSIHRHFGNRSGFFEVLLPDVETAREAVLVGLPQAGRPEDRSPDRPQGAKRAAAEPTAGPSREIARFDLSPRREGGDQ